MDFLTYASLGLSTGGAYALVALGLIAAYRGTGVINFAQGALGTFGAYSFWKLYEAGLPLPLAIAAGVVVSGLIGILFFAVVGKRLAHAPVVTKILITLGLLLVLEAIVRITWTNHQITINPFLVSGGFEVGGVRVQNISLLLGATALIATIALHTLFTRTRFGLITMAIQDTDLGAQSIGIDPRKWGSAAWGLAGVLSAAGSVLVLPITQLSPTSAATLLVPALGAALAAKFRRFWVAFGVAIGAGVLEGLVTGMLDAQLARAVPHIIALGVLIAFARTDMSRGTREVKAVFHVGSGRIKPVHVAIGVAVVVALIAFGNGSTIDALSLTAIFGLVALGIVVSTGYTGQVNALPLTFAGISMLVFGAASNAGASLLVAAAAALVVSLVFAAASSIVFVRARIYEVTIGSLAIASIVQIMVFSVDYFFNGTTGWAVGDTSLFGISVSNIVDPQNFAILAWTVLIVALIAVANIRRSSVGRYLLSVRQDERLPAALGINAVRAKFTSILLSGTLWGLAGILLAVQRGFISKGQITLEGFTYSDSLALIAFTILAGTGHLAGAVLAGLFAPGGLLASILSFTPDINDWLSLFFAVNMVLVLTTEPDGVVGQFLRLRGAAFAKLRARTSAPTSAPKEKAHATAESS